MTSSMKTLLAVVLFCIVAVAMPSAIRLLRNEDVSTDGAGALLVESFEAAGEEEPATEPASAETPNDTRTPSDFARRSVELSQVQQEFTQTLSEVFKDLAREESNIRTPESESNARPKSP